MVIRYARTYIDTGCKLRKRKEKATGEQKRRSRVLHASLVGGAMHRRHVHYMQHPSEGYRRLEYAKTLV